MALLFSDSLHDDSNGYDDAPPQRSEIFSSFQQQFSQDVYAVDVLQQEHNWELSFPNENSGPCYTYNPPYESDPGLPMGIYIVMKDESWDPTLEIFLHDKGAFFYSYNLAWDFLLKAKTLLKEKINHPKLEGIFYEGIKLKLQTILIR